jgi:hypothetical protein
VRRLKQARLHRLHLIATLWAFNEQHKVGKAHDAEIRLAGTNRLNKDKIESGRLHKERCCGGGVRERSTAAARCNGANEATLISRSLFNAHAITKKCTATLYGRRVNGEDRNATASRTRKFRECADKGALSSAWRSGDADYHRVLTTLAGESCQRRLNQRICRRAAALNAADRLGELARGAQPSAVLVS